jgi:hypothetical protein
MKILLIALLGLLAAPLAQAQEGSLLSLQVAILKQTFRYSKHLAQKDTIKIAIVYSKSGSDLKNKMVTEFQSKEEIIYQSLPVIESDLAVQIEKFDVIFLMPEIDAKLAHSLSVKQGVLSSTATESYLKAGYASVGVVIEGGKPQIMINRRSASIEKQEFIGEILSLAKQIE